MDSSARNNLENACLQNDYIVVILLYPLHAITALYQTSVGNTVCKINRPNTFMFYPEERQVCYRNFFKMLLNPHHKKAINKWYITCCSYSVSMGFIFCILQNNWLNLLLSISIFFLCPQFS